jgi:hypothetical protein
MVLDCANECSGEYLTWRDRMLIPPRFAKQHVSSNMLMIHWSSSMENSSMSSA